MICYVLIPLLLVCVRTYGDAGAQAGKAKIKRK